ncbi:helix-turn-helix domain-containing protein, partial [Nocardia brevicatena]|uniref:helix-turn-helix domain-containing protein n=1 Tax=Nocardia brevicatena TaxID=37327 RepID=UPI001C3F1520
MSLAVGHFPVGDEDGMRELAGVWEVVRAALLALVEQQVVVAGLGVGAVAGVTGAVVVEGWSVLERELRGLAEYAGGLAEQLRDGAVGLEFEKLLVIYSGLILLVQLAWVVMLPGGAMVAVASRVAAQQAMRVGYLQLIARLLLRGARFVETRPVLAVVTQGGVFGAVQGGGADLAAQGTQIRQGHRRGVDWGSVRVSAVSGGAGGVGGEAAARWAGSVVGRVGESVGRVIGPRARRAVEVSLLGGVGGVAGSVVGTVASVAMVGGDLAAGDWTEMLVSGFGGGVIGAAGHAIRTPAASAPATPAASVVAGLPWRRSGSSGGPPPAPAGRWTGSEVPGPHGLGPAGPADPGPARPGPVVQHGRYRSDMVEPGTGRAGARPVSSMPAGPGRGGGPTEPSPARTPFPSEPARTDISPPRTAVSPLSEGVTVPARTAVSPLSDHPTVPARTAVPPSPEGVTVPAQHLPEASVTDRPDEPSVTPAPGDAGGHAASAEVPPGTGEGVEGRDTVPLAEFSPLEDIAYQQEVEDALRGPDGHLLVGADPRTNPYGRLINDGGPGKPGRDTNCVATAIGGLRSFLGDPAVAPPRRADATVEGRLGETDGNTRAEAWAGQRFRDYRNREPIPRQFDRLHAAIAAAGPMSSALVAVEWSEHHPDTGQTYRTGHMITVVYPPAADGPVWWDPQSGQTWDTPPPELVAATDTLRFVTLGPDHGARPDPTPLPDPGRAAQPHTFSPRQAVTPPTGSPPPPTARHGAGYPTGVARTPQPAHSRGGDRGTPVRYGRTPWSGPDDTGKTPAPTPHASDATPLTGVEWPDPTRFEPDRFGAWLRKVRELLDLDQRQFAERLDVSRKTVGKWELGHDKPSLEGLVRLCREGGVPPEVVQAAVEHFGLGDPRSGELYRVDLLDQPFVAPKEGESRGEWLRGIRHRLGYSQQQFAKLLGISQRTVGRWETGDVEPSLEGLVRLCREGGVPPEVVQAAVEFYGLRHHLSGELYRVELLDQPFVAPKEGESRGEWFRGIRHRRRLSQQQFGDLLGVSQRTVSEWEVGHDKPS